MRKKNRNKHQAYLLEAFGIPTNRVDLRTGSSFRLASFICRSRVFFAARSPAKVRNLTKPHRSQFLYNLFRVYRAAESLCNQWQQDHGPFFKKILVGKSESSRILNILPKTPKKQLSLPITIFQRLCQFYGVYCNHHLPGFFVLLLTLTISHGHNIVPELIAISFEERKASTISRFVPKANE